MIAEGGGPGGGQPAGGAGAAPKPVQQFKTMMPPKEAKVEEEEEEEDAPAAAPQRPAGAKVAYIQTTHAHTHTPHTYTDPSGAKVELVSYVWELWVCVARVRMCAHPYVCVRISLRPS